MIEIDEIIALSEINGVLKDFKRVGEYEDAFDAIINKLTEIITKKSEYIKITLEKNNRAWLSDKKNKDVIDIIDERIKILEEKEEPKPYIIENIQERLADLEKNAKPTTLPYIIGNIHERLDEIESNASLPERIPFNM